MAQHLSIVAASQPIALPTDHEPQVINFR